MAVKPTMLRDLSSLLQWLKRNNEMTWIMCNLSFDDYRSLLCLTRSLLIKYSFASPLGHLILHQNLLNIRLFHSYPSIHFHSHTHTLSLFHNLNIYIYTFQIIKSAQITDKQSLPQSATPIARNNWTHYQDNKILRWPSQLGNHCSRMVF